MFGVGGVCLAKVKSSRSTLQSVFAGYQSRGTVTLQAQRLCYPFRKGILTMFIYGLLSYQDTFFDNFMLYVLNLLTQVRCIHETEQVITSLISTGLRIKLAFDLETKRRRLTRLRAISIVDTETTETENKPNEGIGELLIKDEDEKKGLVETTQVQEKTDDSAAAVSVDDMLPFFVYVLVKKKQRLLYWLNFSR